MPLPFTGLLCRGIDGRLSNMEGSYVLSLIIIPRDEENINRTRTRKRRKRMTILIANPSKTISGHTAKSTSRVLSLGYPGD